MSIDTHDKFKFDEHITTNINQIDKKYKILLISQNSTDIFLINELLNDLGEFKVYEAANIKAALKVASYLSLDMIIVDDTLPTLSGYEIIKRLNSVQMLKIVPKVMLLTQDYKERLYKNITLENLDFIKKPIDKMIFKTRVHSILKNKEDKFEGGSIFENMIDSKISEAKEFLKIYKSFLDIDQNLLFVYDKKRNKIVESNKNFTKFFGENSLFNRVISSQRLTKRFVVQMSDPNYLNSHDLSTWIDLINSANDFNFLIKLKNRSKEYSFNIIVNKMKLFSRQMYIIKLSNHNIDILRQKGQKNLQNPKTDIYLSTLQSEIDRLDDSLQKQIIVKNMGYLLDELEVNSQFFQAPTIKQENKVNIHFVIAKILKDRLDSIHATLNLQKVTLDFEENKEEIYVKISADDLSDAVRGILDNYHELENLQVDVKVYQLKKNLKIEIITTSIENSSNFLINKFFKKEQDSDTKSVMVGQMLPKHVQNALSAMSADIKTYFNNGQNIFLITIPLD